MSGYKDPPVHAQFKKGSSGNPRGRPKKEAVHHPAHYGGVDNLYEAIKVIEAWGLNFCLGNTIKYISRAGKKDPAAELEDLKKARWYLDREIKQRQIGDQNALQG